MASPTGQRVSFGGTQCVVGLLRCEPRIQDDCIVNLEFRQWTSTAVRYYDPETTISLNGAKKCSIRH
jgi:hypothetical protein